MNGGATISPCGKFRYYLWRRWAPGPLLSFVMLNPSTADGDQDDATIRRCIGFAERLGYSGIAVCNLFAYRATSPVSLRKSGYLVGPDNDKALQALAASTRSESYIVCAWGAHARGLPRVQEAIKLLSGQDARLTALELTSDGIPRHPLMLSYACAAVFGDLKIPC